MKSVFIEAPSIHVLRRANLQMYKKWNDMMDLGV